MKYLGILFEPKASSYAPEIFSRFWPEFSISSLSALSIRRNRFLMIATTVNLNNFMR
jgi:hypothetical protein